MELSIKDKVRIVNRFADDGRLTSEQKEELYEACFKGQQSQSINYECVYLQELIDDGIDVTAEMDDLELSMLRLDISKLLKTLEPCERCIIILEFYNKISLQEIAETANVDIKTLTHIKYRALKKLREQSSDLIDYIHPK